MADEQTHTCGCHDHVEEGHPELDARPVPHAIRHATIFGASSAIGDAFDIDYLERGPEAWRLRFVRRA